MIVPIVFENQMGQGVMPKASHYKLCYTFEDNGMTCLQVGDKTYTDVRLISVTGDFISFGGYLYGKYHTIHFGINPPEGA